MLLNLLEWHVNNPVISVMYSVMGVIKPFSFEVRPNFWKVADECSFSIQRSCCTWTIWVFRLNREKVKWTILKISKFQDLFS
jgi:hypothetical protein